MNIKSRKFLDKIFGGVGILAIITLVSSVFLLLGPIIMQGKEAFLFYGTVEYRRVMLEQFGRGDRAKIQREIEESEKLKEPIYRAISDFEQGIIIESKLTQADKAYRSYKSMFSSENRKTQDVKNLIKEANQIKELYQNALKTSDKQKSVYSIKLLLEKVESRKKFTKTKIESIFIMAEEFLRLADSIDFSKRDTYRKNIQSLKDAVCELLGPFPNEPKPALIRDQYGQTRWKQAKENLHHILFIEKYEHDENMKPHKIEIERKIQFAGSPLESIFPYLEDEDYIKKILKPKLTFYCGFLTDNSKDAHFFGGIWPELLGTIYLTFGCMIFVIPLGIIAAIYLAEYAKETIFIKLIRTCINTLAAVPSIVFGLFGLAFFINSIHLSNGKSVLVGSLTLALLVLPVIIRTSEEAISAVSPLQKEASLALGASLWHTIIFVILPQAMPGILTGVIIGLGRAAGETAPIIFTAAVSVGSALTPLMTFNNPTPALSWNLYNLCTEHEAVDKIRHVQYGMAFSLVLLVLFLSGIAMYIRARYMKKLRSI